MPNLKANAARDGWLAFIDQTPPPTREDINALLATRELPIISTRMYDHYGRLVRHGYDHYVPINEFDMTVKAGRRRQSSQN